MIIDTILEKIGMIFWGIISYVIIIPIMLFIILPLVCIIYIVDKFSEKKEVEPITDPFEASEPSNMFVNDFVV